MIGPNTKIHPYALVRDSLIGASSNVGPFAEFEGATIGDHSGVWSHAKVRAGSKLGNHSGIGHASIVNTNVQIGNRVKIQNQVSIPEGITVGDGVFIGPGAKFPNDRYPRALGAWTVGQIELRFGASIGANALVVCGKDEPTIVGEFALLAAGTTATRSLKPFGLYVGDQQIGWVNALADTISRDIHKMPSIEELFQGTDSFPVEVMPTIEAYKHSLSAR